MFYLFLISLTWNL